MKVFISSFKSVMGIIKYILTSIVYFCNLFVPLFDFCTAPILTLILN